MCTHYFSDDMLWWYFKQEWKNNWDHPHFNQFQMTASTVLIQQVSFSGLYFDEQVPSLQIRITVLFSADLQTPRTALPGFPTTLPIFQNVSTHFLYSCAHSVDASFTHAAWIDENWTLTERRVRHLERTVLGRYLLSCHTVMYLVNKCYWNVTNWTIICAYLLVINYLSWNMIISSVERFLPFQHKINSSYVTLNALETVE